MKLQRRAPAVLEVFAPWTALGSLRDAWWALFGVPLVALLHALIGLLSGWPITLAIGPFGLAVIAMTLLIRVVLLPLAAYQVRASLKHRRESEALNRRLAPAVAALRRRYRRRPADLQRALADLLRREGTSPTAGLSAALRSGLLPALIQAPVLIAFYWVVLGLARAGGDLHLLWIASLASPDALLLPLIAGVSTFVLARLAAAAQPASPFADDQTVAAQKTLSFLYPLGLAISAHFAPAALVLYWVTGNLFAAAQQWAANRFIFSARVSTA